MSDPARRHWSLSPETATRAFWLAFIFITSRLLLVVVALLVEAGVPMQPGGSASAAPILRSLSASDGPWYVGIASGGYHPETLRGPFHDYVFFPLFPAVIRAASTVTGDLVVAAIVVSNTAFAFAMVVFERMSRPQLGERGSLIATAFLTFAPGAVAFGMAYTDSLFLLLGLLAMAAARHGSFAWMSVLYALAALTRLPGVILIVPLAFAMAERHGWRPRRAWLWLLSGPIALLGFLAYVWGLTGDALGYVRAQAAWNNPPDTFGLPGIPDIDPRLVVLALVGVAAFYLFQVVYFRRSGLPPAEAAYAVVGTLAVVVTMRIVSLPRYLAVLWPYSFVLVSRRSSTFQAVALVGFVVAFCGFAFLHFATLVAA